MDNWLEEYIGYDLTHSWEEKDRAERDVAVLERQMPWADENEIRSFVLDNGDYNMNEDDLDDFLMGR